MGHRRGPHRSPAALTWAQARGGSGSRARSGAAVPSLTGGLATADEGPAGRRGIRRQLGGIARQEG
ncbi:hypothetical protein [Streptomyces parvulus]|uniref:hypothetical protein n=1 Tax=Streptomyces parvulus TaxID=146923 RepID=UPI00357131B8